MLDRPKSIARPGAGIAIREGVIHFTDDAGNTFAARGKWFEFYRLLILRDGAVVDRHALSQLKSWSSDGLANGRDVARHLQSQRVCRLQNSIVTSHAVTQEWQFSRGWAIQYDVAETSGTGAAIFKPDGAGYGSVALPDDADIADWAFPALEAYLKFCTGDIPGAYAASTQALDLAPSGDVRAVSLLMCLRLAPRLPATDAALDTLESLADQLHALPPSALGDHARQRYRLYRSLYAPASEWPQLARRLEETISAPSLGLDPIALGYALSYAAVTQRRLGDLARAARQIERALVHAIAGGELFMLQAVLFNFGLIHADLARHAPHSSAAPRAIRALEAVSRITRTHRIGNDSAQNELAIAEILIDQAAFEKAEEYLEEARRIIARSENAYDAAVLAHRQLQICQRRDGASLTPKALQQRIEHCAELYAACERDDLARSMRAELKERLQPYTKRS